MIRTDIAEENPCKDCHYFFKDSAGDCSWKKDGICYKFMDYQDKIKKELGE